MLTADNADNADGWGLVGGGSGNAESCSL